MCGIAGFNFKVNKDYILKQLHHRGPDEYGTFEDKNFSFFHTRLSIQDISNGHQPFFYKNYMIIFNGEIYNHLELRKNLDVNFTTASDTETLLHLYLKYKENMFEMLDGMFSFCIYDGKNLFLARDRTGKKPLYIYQKGNKFGFGSEINTFKFLDLSIDEEDIKQFLSLGFCESGYKEITEFPAGYYGYFDGSLKIKRYFNILDYYHKSKISDIDEVEEVLDKSIKNRLFSSDVEVGAFLSGGIDSGLVVAKASEYTNLKTFTIRFEGQFDESKLASLVAKKYGTNHEIIDIKMDVKNNIEKILLNYGKPFFDSSAIPSYFVAKEARKYLKVVLNGDGADEIFAGYRRYVPLYNNWDKIAKNFQFLLPILNPQKRGINMFLYRLIFASTKNGVEWYNALLNDLFYLKGEKLDKLDSFIQNINLNNFEKLLYLDFELNLKGLLMKMDIATMSNSLEARSPFLSKYFLELAPRMDNKINKTTTKYILRTLAKKYLPEEVVNAPKRGFEIPLINWVEGELREVIFDYLKNGFYKNFVDIDIENLPFSKEKNAKILYLLFSLEVWYENRFS